MLKALITSKARRKILKYFYEQGENNTPYVRQIVRDTELEINAVRRELIRLKKGNILVEMPRGNRLHYQLNIKHPYYYNLARIFARESGLGKEILKNKKKLGSIVFCLVSLGFYLKREHRNPVDTILIGNIYLTEIKKLINKFEIKENTEVNYMVLSKEEFKIFKDRKDPLLINALNQPHSVIIGDEYKYLN